MTSKYHEIPSLSYEEASEYLENALPARRQPRIQTGLAFFAFEIAHVLLFYLLFLAISKQHVEQVKANDLNISYEALHGFTSTVSFDLWGYRDQNANMSLWDGIFPQGEGLISVPRQNNLKALQTSRASPLNEKHMIYQVGVFHHLHCLRAIKWALEGIFVPPLLGIAGPGDPMDHPLHCVDWIRQALMCNADLSLDATDYFWTFGHESRHRCRNFDAVLAWTEDHRFRGSLTDLRKMSPAKPAPWLQEDIDRWK